jgi:hypothetical protein
MAMEAGLLEQPPEEAIIPVSEFMGVIPDPAISYSSRLALALDQLGMNGFERQLETDLVIAQTRPDILDNYDFDRITRDRARSNGMPAAWMLDGEEVAATRQARAEAAQAQQAAMMLEQGSKAVKNMGGVDETKKAMEEMA